MALVNIILRDDPDGGIDIHVESEPPFPGKATWEEKATYAQAAALTMLAVLGNPDEEGISATFSA